MAVGMSHQFVGLFGRGIQADRTIDVVLCRKRQLGVGAIDRGRRRIEQMTAFMMPTSLQDIEESLEIGIGIGMGMIDRMADAGLRPKMGYTRQPTFFGQPV